jgi:DNA-binding MarR family transcriptional regulator
MTRIVAKLEERGLIGRTPHPTDGRQVFLAATESGRAVLAEHRRAREVWLARRLATLTADERETLRRAAEIIDRLGRS